MGEALVGWVLSLCTEDRFARTSFSDSSHYAQREEEYMDGWIGMAAPQTAYCRGAASHQMAPRREAYTDLCRNFIFFPLVAGVACSSLL